MTRGKTDDNSSKDKDERNIAIILETLLLASEIIPETEYYKTQMGNGHIYDKLLEQAFKKKKDFLNHIKKIKNET